MERQNIGMAIEHQNMDRMMAHERREERFEMAHERREME